MHKRTHLSSPVWFDLVEWTALGKLLLAHAHTHKPKHTHTLTHARARARTHTQHTHTRTHTYARTQTYAHTCTRIYTYAHAHARTCTHAHTQTHTHTRTHKRARTRTLAHPDTRVRVNEDAWTKTNKAHICTYTHDIMMSVLVHDSWLNTYRKALWKGSSRHCAPSIVKCTTFLQQHTATLRNRLQHFTTDCNTSQQTATQDIARNCNTHMRLRPIKKPIKERHICSNTLQHFAIDCNIKSRLKSPFRDCCIPSETVALLQKKPIEPSNMPYHWALCSVWQCLALWCTVLQCVAVCCSVLQCDAQGYSVLQCGV